MTCVSMPPSIPTWPTCGQFRGSNAFRCMCHRTRRRFVSAVRLNFPLIRMARCLLGPISFCAGATMDLHPQFTLLFRAEVPTHFHCCPQLQSPKIPFGSCICVVVVKSLHSTTARGEPTVHCAPLSPRPRSTNGHIQVLSGPASCQKQTCHELETKPRAIRLMSISPSQRDCGSGRGIPEVAAAEAEASPS